MIELCGLCGAQPDNHDVRVTLVFAAGLRNGNHFLELPHMLENWPVCWDCFTSEACKVLRLALADEYLEPVTDRHVVGCHAVCDGGMAVNRGRWRRFFSVRQGSRGVGETGRCPVCYGPALVELAGKTAAWGER